MVSHGAQSTMFGSLTPQCIGVGITEEMCRLENVKKDFNAHFKWEMKGHAFSPAEVEALQEGPWRE